MAVERKALETISSQQCFISSTINSLETNQLKQTKFNKVFHLVQEQQPSDGTYAILWPVKRTTKSGPIESQFLGAETTVRWMMHGRDEEEEGDILLVLPNGKLVPSYLPDMSDLALLPKHLKVLVRWQLQKDLSAGMCGNAMTSDPQVNKLLWQSPIVPQVREWVWASLGSNNVPMSSYLDTFKVITISPFMKVGRIAVKWKHYTKDQLDGRKWDIALEVGWRSQGYSRLKRFIVWNCKGMARPAFSSHFKHVVDYHRPDCIILVETRCSSRMAQFLSRMKLKRRTSSLAAVLGQGGASVIVFVDDIQVGPGLTAGSVASEWPIDDN